MMHAPASSFRAAAAAQDAAPPPVTPAAYLRLRREYAGLTIVQLANRLTTHPDQRSLAGTMLALLETPGVVAKTSAAIENIARVLPLDAAVYWQLAHDPVEAHPRICRGCGYTVWDAYSVEDDLRTWVTDTDCSACAPATEADQ